MRDLFFADNYLAGTLVRPPARAHKLCAWIYGFFMWPEMQVYVRRRKPAGERGSKLSDGLNLKRVEE
jgi:hypothetical protein